MNKKIKIMAKNWDDLAILYARVKSDYDVVGGGHQFLFFGKVYYVLQLRHVSLSEHLLRNSRKTFKDWGFGVGYQPKPVHGRPKKPPDKR